MAYTFTEPTIYYEYALATAQVAAAAGSVVAMTPDSGTIAVAMRWRGGPWIIGTEVPDVRTFRRTPGHWRRGNPEIA